MDSSAGRMPNVAPPCPRAPPTPVSRVTTAMQMPAAVRMADRLETDPLVVAELMCLSFIGPARYLTGRDLPFLGS